MDGAFYVHIVQDHCIRNATKQFDRRWPLQEHNDPKHKSRVAKEFLTRHVPEIIVAYQTAPMLTL